MASLQTLLKKRAKHAAFLIFACAIAWTLSAIEANRSILPVLSSSQTFPTFSGELKVWIFDIGQGDSILIQAPTGEELLVDGGPDAAVLGKLGAVLPPTDRTIDSLLLTHPHADHSIGLIHVLDRYQVGTVYETGAMVKSDAYRSLEAAIMTETSPRIVPITGDHIALGAVDITIIFPSTNLDNTLPKDPNDTSITLLVKYGETTILLTGDAGIAEEKLFGPLAGDIDILKAGHHGSRTSSSAAFLDVVKPEFAIISCGVDNDYGHPHPEIVERFKVRGTKMFRTDLDHDVLIRSTGGEPTVEAHPLPF